MDLHNLVVRYARTIDPALLAHLARFDPPTAYAVARRYDTPASLVAELAHHPSKLVRGGVLSRYDVTGDNLTAALAAGEVDSRLRELADGVAVDVNSDTVVAQVEDLLHNRVRPAHATIETSWVARTLNAHDHLWAQLCANPARYGINLTVQIGQLSPTRVEQLVDTLLLVTPDACGDNPNVKVATHLLYSAWQLNDAQKQALFAWVEAGSLWSARSRRASYLTDRTETVRDGVWCLEAIRTINPAAFDATTVDAAPMQLLACEAVPTVVTGSLIADAVCEATGNDPEAFSTLTALVSTADRAELTERRVGDLLADINALAVLQR